ncbi:MAG TPA: hypothetical protein VNM50_08485 [Chloroflexota bacterium]|nr:hypothetical protein [Chloroflexota bacterium]
MALWLAVAARPMLAQSAAPQDDPTAVRAAVERANAPEVWGEALRRGDPAPLAEVWTGDALAYFAGEVRAYAARGLRLLSTPVHFEILDVTIGEDGHARVATREEWHDVLCTADGRVEGRRQAVVRDVYALVWRDGRWWVEGVDIGLEAGSFAWEPPPAADDTACSAGWE